MGDLRVRFVANPIAHHDEPGHASERAHAHRCAIGHAEGLTRPRARVSRVAR